MVAMRALSRVFHGAPEEKERYDWEWKRYTTGCINGRHSAALRGLLQTGLLVFEFLSCPC
jgi:hypothetical protein